MFAYRLICIFMSLSSQRHLSNIGPYKSLVGGVAQWLGRRSLAVGLP